MEPSGKKQTHTTLKNEENIHYTYTMCKLWTDEH